MSAHTAINTIIEHNGLEIRSEGNDGVRTKSIMIGENKVRFLFFEVKDKIEVMRMIDERTDSITIPKDAVRLYTHILTPHIEQLNIPAEGYRNLRYPEISGSDILVKLFLCYKGDIIKITRLVAYQNTGTQKTTNLYQVV